MTGRIDIQGTTGNHYIYYKAFNNNNYTMVWGGGGVVVGRLTEKCRPEPGLEPQVSRYTYERSTD